jgi:hypothetical protein
MYFGYTSINAKRIRMDIDQERDDDQHHGGGLIVEQANAGNEMKADAAGADEASTVPERMLTSKR